MKVELSKRFLVFQLNDDFCLGYDDSFDHVLIGKATKEEADQAVMDYMKSENFALSAGSFVVLEVMQKKNIW